MTAIAAVGIKSTARFQLAIASIEYLVLLVFSAIAFWAVFVEHRAGTVHPSLSWLHVSGVGGKGSLAGAMLIAIFLFTGWDATIYINEETTKQAHQSGQGGDHLGGHPGAGVRLALRQLPGGAPAGPTAGARRRRPSLHRPDAGRERLGQVHGAGRGPLGARDHPGHHRLHQPSDLFDGN